MTIRATPSPSWRDSENPPRPFADGGAGAALPADAAGAGDMRGVPVVAVLDGALAAAVSSVERRALPVDAAGSVRPATRTGFGVAEAAVRSKSITSRYG